MLTGMLSSLRAPTEVVKSIIVNSRLLPIDLAICSHDLQFLVEAGVEVEVTIAA